MCLGGKPKNCRVQFVPRSKHISCGLWKLLKEIRAIMRNVRICENCREFLWQLATDAITTRLQTPEDSCLSEGSALWFTLSELCLVPIWKASNFVSQDLWKVRSISTDPCKTVKVERMDMNIGVKNWKRLLQNIWQEVEYHLDRCNTTRVVRPGFTQSKIQLLFFGLLFMRLCALFRVTDTASGVQYMFYSHIICSLSVDIADATITSPPWERKETGLYWFIYFVPRSEHAASGL